MQNDIDERKKLKSTFECDLCSKVFKREAFMERYVIKVHTNVIPQVDGIEDVIENCLQEMFKTIEKEPLNSVKINTSHILPNKMKPSIMCVQCDIAF